MSYKMKTRVQVLVPSVVEIIQQYAKGLISVTQLVMHLQAECIHVESLSFESVIIMHEDDLANCDFVEGIFEERFEVSLDELRAKK